MKETGFSSMHEQFVCDNEIPPDAASLLRRGMFTAYYAGLDEALCQEQERNRDDQGENDE